MAISQVPPLSSNVPIVYPPGHPSAGCPTPAFATLMQILLDEKAITDALAAGAIQPGTVTTSGLTAAAQRILGNKEATTGAIEELTLSQALDLIGSAAQGDLLFRGSAGWQRLAAGTSGQFLKTLGAGADPAWGTVSGGGGGMALLDSQTVSGVSSVAFTSLISSTYKMYRLEWYNLTVSTTATSMLLRVSTDNGATWDSGTNYTYAGHQATQGTFASAGLGAANSTSLKIENSLRNTAGDVAAGELLMLDPSNTAGHKQFLARTGGEGSDGNYYERVWSGRWQNTAAFNAFQIIPSAGTFSGTFRLLGYA